MKLTGERENRYSNTNNGNFVEDCEGKGEKEQEEGVWGGKRAKLKAVMYT